MKSNWRVTANPVAGKMLYGVYRLRDVSGIDHSGNRETKGGYFNTREEAEALAERLNEEEREKWESTIRKR